MKRIFPAFFAILFALNIFASGTPRTLFEIPEYQSHISNSKLLVQFNDHVSEATIPGILKNIGDLAGHEVKLAKNVYMLRLKANTNVQNIIQKIKELPEIKHVSPWLKDIAGNERALMTELYVNPKMDSDIEFLRLESRKYGFTVKGEWSSLPGVWIIEADKNSKYNALELSIWLNELGIFEYTDVNYAFFPIVHTNDPLYNRQWAIQNVGGLVQGNGTVGADMDVVSAWNISTGNPSIKVAILDSGVDTLHPDLVDNLLPGYDATGHGSAGYPNLNGFQSDGHGTSCAGIVAAKGNNSIGIAGIAYDCKIIPIKIFYYIDTTIFIPGVVDTTLQEIPYSNTAFMVNAINWAFNTSAADVLSNSWGIPANLLALAPVNQPTVSNVIHNAALQGRGGKGAIQMFSSGNDNDILIWPSTLDDNMAVGSSTNKDKRASYSNFGDKLDFAAPGDLICTTDMLGAPGFSSTEYINTFAGTSAACPMAAGVAALVLSVRPDFTYQQVRSLMRSTSEKVGGYAYDSIGVDGSWSQQLGYGRLNAFNAVTAAPVFSTENFPQIGYSFQIWPNPTSNFVNITAFAETNGKADLSILDMTGKLVKRFQGITVSQGENSFQLGNLNDLAAGCYSLQMKLGASVINRKLIIKQ